MTWQQSLQGQPEKVQSCTHMGFPEHSKARTVHEPVPSQRVSKVESVLTGAQANDRTSKLDHAVTVQLELIPLLSYHNDLSNTPAV